MNYRSQVELLLRILPYIAEEKKFALKGGTAINMFEWDMPRLSVDIDLVYLPIDDRKTALINITKALDEIKEKIIVKIPDSKVAYLKREAVNESKLICYTSQAQVKVEVNTVMRGTAFPLRIMQVSDSVQQEFGKFAEMQVISRGELFGGKICAALDRQHPRDLFDVYHLLNRDGITKEIKDGLIVAILSHNRPINELLDPHFKNQEQTFIKQFQGMALKPFSYKDFENAFKQLQIELCKSLTENDKKLLLSFKAGEVKWDLSEIKQLRLLPAVQWKLANIQKLMQKDPMKHKKLLDKLYMLLSSNFIVQHEHI